MGWLILERRSYETPKQYLDKQCTWSDPETGVYHRLLRSAMVGATEYYAAIERTVGTERTVFAVVILVRHYRRTNEWGYKDMDENMDPNAANCPLTILDLLTPTDYPNAIVWRNRCRENAARKKAARTLEPGTALRYGNRQYTVQKKLNNGYSVLDENGCSWRLRFAQARHSTIL